MVETSIFNAPSITTTDIDIKNLYIWPRTQSHDERVNILDLITTDDYYYPFKVQNNGLVEAEYATGWFIPSKAVNNTLYLNGTAYSVELEEGENLVDAFVTFINESDYLPITAKADGEKIILTAAVGGTSGNNILISCEPLNCELADCISGTTLTGGVDEYYSIDIKGGTIYLPNNYVCQIPDKKNLKLNPSMTGSYIVLNLNRLPSGELTYSFEAVSNDNNYFIPVAAREIN